MTDTQIVSKFQEFILLSTKSLCTWLSARLPKLADDWYNDCVVYYLTENQLNIAKQRNFTKIEDFDLAALLRVTIKNWYAMRSQGEFLPQTEKDRLVDMQRVRNNWAHCAGIIPGKDEIVSNLETIIDFLGQIGAPEQDISTVRHFKQSIENSDISQSQQSAPTPVAPAIIVKAPKNEIVEKDMVYLVGEPGTKGMVFSIDRIGSTTKYTVFVNGELKTFYDGQIAPIVKESSYKWIDTISFTSHLSAYEINNPTAGNLYSLNSARIDFVPYQFRPALKMIQADEPRILIADSVGVGKTIETGLIIKELEARNELNNVLIICPKPLVTERKWELEMQRFDEEFTPLDGKALRQIISDTDRDGEWPSRFNKVIIPYSILDERVYEGEPNKKGPSFSLTSLDPAPHFDLVIIDEAHYLRNGSIDKEKAYAYKCAKYFCDHADAVVLLTATPLQNSSDDLFTLLNLLRPDLLIDKQSFSMMSRPNKFIADAVRLARSKEDDWRDKITLDLQEVAKTQWGSSVIAKNPVYDNVLKTLDNKDMSRDERVKLISNLESLHSFNTIMNRTRRKDIQDFCIRKPKTLSIRFTQEQALLHDQLLQFVSTALSMVHGAMNVKFMMSTLMRQAASSIFGLAPFIEDIINRRFESIYEESNIDLDHANFDGLNYVGFKNAAKEIIEMANNLSDEDPKFDAVMQVVREKQTEENNKIILFSTFHHTLNYLKKRFIEAGLRVGIIDGSVKDNDRLILRERFQKPKDDEDSLDLLLFSEVGAEGLDYQFCDMMINYDLPWNPMKVEQRIGRIDRRGQKSEFVTIVNPITEDTVDAIIYEKCFLKIGIFVQSIGECEEILGEITHNVEDIVLDRNLSEKEKEAKIEQMADNEVRKMQELSNLEDREKDLFGFNLSNYTMSKEIESAESPWITPQSLQTLVARYFNERLGEGNRILGESAIKSLRLSAVDRETLKQDFQKLSSIKSSAKRKWENYLKGTEQYHEITFDNEAAKENRKAFLITTTHPLVKQAASFFASSDIKYIGLKVSSDSVEPGQYPFEVYAWSYKGLNNRFQLKIVSKNQTLNAELADMLGSSSSYTPEGVAEDSWKGLEELQIGMWNEARKSHIDSVIQSITYKIETLKNNYNNRKRILENDIKTAVDENLIRMKKSQIEHITEQHEMKLHELESKKSLADIHTTIVARGIVVVQ